MQDPGLIILIAEGIVFCILFVIMVYLLIKRVRRTRMHHGNQVKS